MAATIASACDEILEKLKELEYPYFMHAITAIDLEAMIFQKAGASRLDLLWWLFGKLGIYVPRSANAELYKSLFDAAVQNGFCSKQDNDLIIGGAPKKKQAIFFLLLLDLAIDFDSSEKTTGNFDLRARLTPIYRDAKEIIPDHLRVRIDRMESVAKYDDESLRQEIRLHEDELEEKQKILKSLPNITPPTGQKHARFLKVVANLDVTVKKFLNVYNQELAIWCKPSARVCLDPALSSRLGTACEKINERLDELSQVFTDTKAIATFNDVDIDEMKKRTLLLNEKLDSDSSSDTLLPNNIDSINQMTDIFQAVADVITRHKHAS